MTISDTRLGFRTFTKSICCVDIKEIEIWRLQSLLFGLKLHIFIRNQFVMQTLQTFRKRRFEELLLVSFQSSKRFTFERHYISFITIHLEPTC